MHRQRRHHSHRSEEHHHRSHSPSRSNKSEEISKQYNDSLRDRVVRVGKTITDLKAKLDIEKELLWREKVMSGSMFDLPTTSQSETPSFGPKAMSSTAYDLHSDYCNTSEMLEHTMSDGLETLLGFEGFQQLHDPIFSEYITPSENDFLEREHRAALFSRSHAYRKHLQEVEDKCKEELGAVESNINNLKRVSTELIVEIQDTQNNAGGERLDVGSGLRDRSRYP